MALSSTLPSRSSAVRPRSQRYADVSFYRGAESDTLTVLATRASVSSAE